MIFLSVQEPPKLPNLIENVIEIQKEPPQQELTLEQKIANNHYGCDEAVEWIRADNAQCLPKRLHKVQNTNTRAVRSSYSVNWYPKGQCTWYVATRRPVGAWNNATDWKWQAIRDGYTYSSTPVAGAIAWKPGHVAFTEAVDGNRVLISEANYDWKGSIRTIWVDVTEYSYLY